MKLFNSITISTRFNLLNLALVLITALSVEIIVSYVQLTRQLETGYEHSEAIATLLAETSEYAVYTRQTIMLEHQIAKLSNIPSIEYVQIQDEHNQILAKLNTRHNTPDLNQNIFHGRITFYHLLKAWNDQQIVEIVLPITSSNFNDEGALFLETATDPKVIGYVKLAMSLNYFKQIIKHSLQLGLVIVIIILLVGVGISLTMTARITSPLKHLTHAAHGVITGQIEPIHLISADAEILEVEKAFNLMIHWLKNYRHEVEKYQSILERQAYYDDLTGLANRVLLKDQLKMELNQIARRQCSIALLFLDLDRFKSINDTLGHSFGDQLLQEVAQRLRNQVRASDIVARMGGDEFILILTNLSKSHQQAQHEAKHIAEQIGLTLKQPFEINGHDINTSFSIGIALSPHDSDEGEILIRNADCAMYEAKNQGRNTYKFYDPSQQQRGLRRLNLESGLKNALNNQELQLHFQPKFNSSNQQLVGAEALLRWKFNNTWISPSEFIPIAEETGLIIPIGEWIMETALATLTVWHKLELFDSAFHIGVNVAPQQFWHPDFAKRTLDIVNRGMPKNTAGVLELELTESCLLKPNFTIQNTFMSLKNAGLRFAIDDFGTGYSSLSYLKSFPLDVLKIDQSFVKDCIQAASNATIIRAIIAMAGGLGLDVIAEGVETLEQAAFLKSEGCHLMQGYLLAKPMNHDDFISFCLNFRHHAIHQFV